MNHENIARRNLLRKSEEARGIAVKGYDFCKGVDYAEIVKSFASTGFQATEFSRAVELVNAMIADKATIFLGYTSNMVSSGIRDILRYLVQEKKIAVLVTTAGGIEEDIIKCLGDFVIGDFRASGKALREKGINRIGNIFVPNERYVRFEQFMQPLLEELYQEQRTTGRAFRVSQLISKLGEKLNDERSICTWAWRNKIPMYCPAIGDGAIGDNIYFFSFKHDDFTLDLVDDIRQLNNTTLGLKRAGVILLGSGIVKHSILNAMMLRNGAEYAVYINTAQEFDGSDAGALPDEAVSWGKILPEGKGKSVKVFADATLVFPLLVAETFAREK